MKMILSNVLLVFIISILLVLIVYLIKKNKIQLNNLYTHRHYVYRKDEFPLNIYFDSTTMKNENFHILLKAIQVATKRLVTKFNFEFFIINGDLRTYKNTLLIQIVCGSHDGCISNFDGRGGVLAHATYPPYRQICIDCKDLFYEYLDIVIMHEFGHILGLEHTDDYIQTRSLMNSRVDKTLDNFTKFDVEVMKKIYKFLK